MTTELNKIAGLLEKTFTGPAWHGPSVMEALDDISDNVAANKIQGSHSISELVQHMAAWRIFVARRLSGDNQFEVSDEENFPKGKNWDEAKLKLQESQRTLIKALMSFSDEKLFIIVPTRTYDFYTMLHGIIQHDIYHTGQIILLKK